MLVPIPFTVIKIQPEYDKGSYPKVINIQSIALNLQCKIMFFPILQRPRKRKVRELFTFSHWTDQEVGGLTIEVRDVKTFNHLSCFTFIFFVWSSTK